nr:putative disease resistance protein RGA3 [Ziziphus jujuba var. spinosa]
MVKMSFPKLNFLRIDNLGRLITFSSEIDINFPILTKLYMEDCPEFLTFISKSEYEKLPSLFNEKVAFSSLKNLKIRAMKKLKMIANNADVFQHLEEVEVIDCPSLKSIFPLSIAKGLSKLRKLYLSYRGIEQIVEAVGTTVSVPPEFVFPRLEEMKLYHLENLVCIYPGLHTSSWPLLATLVVEKCEKVKVLVLEFSCFQDKHVHHDHDSSSIPQLDSFPNLEKLELLECNLEKIWDGELLPKSRSFSKLASLHMRGCGFLKNLFSSAVAANSKQLQSLDITDCKLIEEIMSKNGKVDKAQFTGLKLLNFENPSSLVSFSTEIFIEFPLLTEVSINRCPTFKSFVSKLEEKDCTTMTSLFNDKVAFPSLQSVEIKGLVELKMIWQYKLSTADSFSKLKHRRLHNLKRLEISDCEMVEEVFEIQMPNVEGIYNVIPSKSKLIGLSLVRLSKLKNVWSKDPQGTLTFPHLKEVTAESCPNLESIFLASIGKGLFQLQTLHISDCGIEYIVGVRRPLLGLISILVSKELSENGCQGYWTHVVDARVDGERWKCS